MKLPKASFKRRSKKGLFITLEGPEGAGKSLQTKRLVSRLKRAGYAVEQIRDPGSTQVGRALRRVLLHETTPLAPLTEALLFISGRMRLVEECVLPALEAGKIVICDRYHDSMVAYQAFGGSVPAEWLDAFGRSAIGDVMPDISFLLDLPPEVGMARLNRTKDRMENKGLNFHRKVRRGYRTLAKQNPKRICVIDAKQDVEEVAEQINANVDIILKRSADHLKR